MLYWLLQWNFHFLFTALFNNMRTLKFKGRPTNAFFTAVNQIFSGSSQLTTTAEHCFVAWIVHSDLVTAPSAAVGSCEEPPNISLTVAKNTFVGWDFNFRVRVLLKGAVKEVIDNIELHQLGKSLCPFKWSGTRQRKNRKFSHFPLDQNSGLIFYTVEFSSG